MAFKVVIESVVSLRGSNHQITLEGTDAVELAKEVKDAIAELENATINKPQIISH